MLDFWGCKKVEGWLAPVAIAGYAAFFITDKGVTELELVSCLMHLLFAAAAYASQEMWQCVGLRLVCNMCLLIFDCASVLARNFMRFTGRASQSQLPRCPVPLDLEVLRLQLIVLLDGLLRWLGSRFGPFSADAHIDGLHFGVGPTVDDGCCGSSSLDSTTAC